MKKIGFIGAGKIAQALAKGFISAGLTKGPLLKASCDPRDIASQKAFKELGAEIAENNKQLVNESEVVFFAVKPTILEKIVQEIRNEVSNKHLLISVAMGIPLITIERYLPKGTRVVRAMPNTSTAHRVGATVFCMGSAATEDDATYLHRLLESVGICENVSENLLDSVTGLSGSGPAYVYMVVEALADGGVRMGIPRDLALRLATYTVLGASKTLIESGKHPAVLREEVTSPSGTTAAGLYSLESHKMRSAFIEAVEVATKRAKEINMEIMKSKLTF